MTIQTFSPNKDLLKLGFKGIFALDETRPYDGKYKIIIAGSRSLTNYDEIKPIIDFYLSKRIDDKNLVIMSGMAKGIDKIAHRYAKEHNIPVEEFNKRADPNFWKKMRSEIKEWEWEMDYLV